MLPYSPCHALTPLRNGSFREPFLFFSYIEYQQIASLRSFVSNNCLFKSININKLLLKCGKLNRLPVY
ncbi:hypothetical protein QY97_01335 [Bacillus thermotolerans]|uniref:Uncharacterized protein n=1 Tax=Bacillus thermotolerans TaxID=1221996 RepID=A0A0F5HQL9_BACTR|nr:hypothetical protein QY95_03396 [Bacillus thermotolerans]KKB36067.1 hypothetical protein QY97_01335 [Bacillus thermotolerans]KKB42687.1 hypothetical protein QY96_01329 [Bacillus thermotolerans]